MAIDPPEFPTESCDPRVAIGGACEILRVGDSLEKSVGWDIPVIDPGTGNETCDFTPADFTGYIPTAVVLDKDDVVLAVMTVLPNPGDATATFVVTLTQAQVTTALRDNAVRWSLSIALGGVKRTLIYAAFTVS